MEQVYSYDLETGLTVWPQPRHHHERDSVPRARRRNRLVMSGYRGNNLQQATRLADARGDITGTGTIARQLDRDTPYAPSPLLYD